MSQNRPSNPGVRAFGASLVKLFIISILKVIPVAFVGFWLLAAVFNRLNEDHQMWLFFLVILPFAVGCCIRSFVLYHKVTQQPNAPLPWLVSTIFAAALVWPMLVLSIMVLDPLQLPMVDERTPTTFTIWATFTTGWLFLILACETVFVLMTYTRLRLVPRR